MIYRKFLRRPTIIRDSYPEAEVWAVITEVDDDIGREYSLQLAEQGFNILMFSKDLNKANEVSDLVQTQHPKSETKVFEVDWKGDLDEILVWVKDELDPLNVRVLVNNATIRPDKPSMFHETPIEEDLDMINVNVNVVVRMTRLVLPYMLEKAGGYVINMSSFVMWKDLPYVSVYNSTKRFLANWSLCMNFEYRMRNVRTSYVLAFFSDFKFPYFLKLKWLMPTPQKYVKQTLAQLGTSYRIIPHWSHWFLHKFISQDLGIFNFLHKMWFKRTYGNKKNK
ncbi:very-long-chain 3-oxooacyl-coa reductase [Anaeramoeba flamelloides]|uniref:Very-long-chain 3-oxooacyl-coa reductase n=1 Tax=Anaeramoeba flamelloides TaxID=1746091 RepID=A0AAV7Y0N5_9EUKA|nr:very-long-chain 3-oxooacyl-coa reductase [Anaeramoeba flamelloides]